MLKGLKTCSPIKRAVRRHQKPVQRPGAVAQRRMERRQCPEWAALLVELPDRKAEAALGAIDPEHLAALPPGIDRHPRCAEQFGKALSTQHIVARDNFGDTSATTLTRPGERCLKFSVGRSRVPDGKPIIRSEWLFLDRRDRRCASGRIDLDPERHAVADLAAACDRFLVALEQYLLEIGLCRQFCGKAQGLEARMPIVS